MEKQLGQRDKRFGGEQTNSFRLEIVLNWNQFVNVQVYSQTEVLYKGNYKDLY